MVFKNEDLSQVAIESYSAWDSNLRPMNFVHSL